MTGDQREVVQFLASPSTHGCARVECIETHASLVFLAGSRALKLKRAVRYDYLDFSTAARRKAMCDAEVRVNRRTAPRLYHGVLGITREPDGSLALDGTGTPVDWVVEMARFDQELLLDRMAARDHLHVGLMVPLAAALARLHRDAEPRPDHGGVGGMRWVVDGNALGFADQGSGILDPASCRGLTERARAAIERHAAQLDERRADGHVRQCHGDLHLRNIVLLDGVPTPFDAVEFNDRISCTDVLYDLSFLLMDLWRRQLPRHANVVWNRYLFERQDLDALGLLPLFLSCRAAVRAKTSASAATLQDERSRAEALSEMARDYLAMAVQLLDPPRARLVAVGGLSGSGKSTLAASLAPRLGPAPGAVVLRSDEIRKQLCGVDPIQPLGAAGYTDDVTRRVYQIIRERAASVLRCGHAVIADAVFAPGAERDAIEHTASAAHVPFIGVWLDAPEPVLAWRAEHRRDDASDADAAVVRWQRSQPVGVVNWPRVDASCSTSDILVSALALVDQTPGVRID